ncbi:hypothetical protein O4H49_18175 [Kiloniella laminariae]|uniref:Uncharacterized protein n=1 Tax=Kiloniella laminariae TaxID=454162 RepID=A0ABT4LNN2_9PROT|nr:hypothetical protein [Kiloniella laminariae]MCZ4282716.1 hypothetical protein [Kiloniella laminariae]
MNILGNTFYDLIDLYSQNNLDETTVRNLKILGQNNSILEDAICIEGHDGDRHFYTTFPSLETLSTIDERVLALSGNRATLRQNDTFSCLEEMSRQLINRFFYNDPTLTLDGCKSFASVLNESNAHGQIVDAGGMGNSNTSIWFVTWSERHCYLAYPEGTKAGLLFEDMGSQRITDKDNAPYYALETKYSWSLGLIIKDWRYISRVANIDVRELETRKTELYNFLRLAYNKLNMHFRRSDTAGGRQVIYCNRVILSALDEMATGESHIKQYPGLKLNELDGAVVLTYKGIPIRDTDALLLTEERVST